MMIRLIDSHVHLDDGAFDPDRSAVIERARAAGVESMIVPGVDKGSWSRIDALRTSHPQIFAAFGLHPVFLRNHAPGDVDALPAWLEHHHAVAVGEIGLDFFVTDLDHDLQRQYFTAQLQIAKQRNLPVIVHARAALEEVSLTLRRIGNLRGVVHSFSGSEQQAKSLWDNGFMLGIGGPVTYERARRLRRLVANMPIEFLLLESDAPDQPDASHRGQRNEPARIADILRCIAELRGESQEHIATATSDNARRLFSLPAA